MPNEEFTDPRLVAVYDRLDGDRRDLEPYLDLVDRLGARTALDIGCGTGVLALLLAERGLDVIAVDPAPASLAVAGAKPGGDAVRWLHGDIGAVDVTDREVALMTGNTAQQLTGDVEWRKLLDGAHAALVAGGRLVFETRDPGVRDWETWTPEATRRTVRLDGVGEIEQWTEVVSDALPLVAFRSTWRFAADGAVLTSDSTLRFRTEDELRADLDAAGFGAVEVLDAPDRPGKELVFVAQR